MSMLKLKWILQNTKWQKQKQKPVGEFFGHSQVVINLFNDIRGRYIDGLLVKLDFDDSQLRNSDLFLNFHVNVLSEKFHPLFHAFELSVRLFMATSQNFNRNRW